MFPIHLQGSAVLRAVFRTPLAETGHEHHEGQEALQGEDEEVHPEEEVAGKHEDRQRPKSLTGQRYIYSQINISDHAENARTFPLDVLVHRHRQTSCIIE